MAYTIDRTFPGASIEDIDARTRAALADKGFGVLTEINVKAVMKKKIDADVDPYIILGACNPQMAHKAIGMEPRIGALLPCNVILRQIENGVEVSAIDPLVAFEAIENADMKSLAAEVKGMLEDALANI